ncbi:MAG: MBL fold metallo-hydrolase [Limnochordaceae bacterium]|nr:MBL fold metallo-hydrolase [Limnochordaceae bacterium]
MVHADPPHEEVFPGIWRVPIAIPVPLRYVNSYLIEGDAGWTVVDAGHHTPQAEARWEQVLGELGIGFADIEQIVVTHYHPDHIGCAGWLQQRCHAPVLILDKELPQVERFWDGGSDAGEAIEAQFVRHGVPAEVTRQLPAHHLQQVAMVHPLPRLTPLAEGSRIRVGRRSFEVLWTPGHSEGLLVLWEPDERLLVADDLILRPITPNISLWPHSRVNPLIEYLRSLERVQQLPARLVLPGHRHPIEDLARRIDELRAHHRERLDRVEAIVSARAAAADGRGDLLATAWDVQLQLFGPQPELIGTRFAVAEALSHLEWLVEHGRLRHAVEEPVVRYAPA